MKKFIIPLVFIIIAPFLSNGQTTDKIANEAFVLTRMVNKFHVEPRPVNTDFSADVFRGMLDKTDADRIFFTQKDISQLNRYKRGLDAEIKGRKTGYLNLFVSIYKRRLKQTDSIVNIIGKTPADFYTAEKLTAAEDTLYPASIAALQLKLGKKLKALALDDLAEDLPVNFKTYPTAKKKKYLDSAVLAKQKKAVALLKRRIGNILQSPMGITQYVGNIYCETIASCFDPHTEFFPPDEKENFESALGKQPFQFGFRMKPDKNGGVLIDNLQPGSPAFKSGKLKKGDKFMGLQWEGTAPVDVSDMTLREFTELIDEGNHKKILFTMKKADGPVVQVPLEKAQVADDDADKVKSFVLKGNNTVGYIYLPAFYQDWDNMNDGTNGCANDVGREILKLKKENINGLILDVRYNGGGSVHEAAELAGIFIDAGPVAQQKERDAKIKTINDTDRGTLYDGPLVVLVNGYSASASELLAGTLQDYNRAVIIGSPTYGKATMQVVLPMDTTVSNENFLQKKTDNYLKVTVGKLYRVTGATAQFKGVQPDILLPDVLDAYITKEADEPFSLRPTVISANKYYQPYPPLPIKVLTASVQPEIDTSKYFNAVKNFIISAKNKKAAKDISLNLNDFVTNISLPENDVDDILTTGTQTKKFTVENNQQETLRLQANSDYKELNEEFRHQVAADAYVKIAYDVLFKLKP